MARDLQELIRLHETWSAQKLAYARMLGMVKERVFAVPYGGEYDRFATESLPHCRNAYCRSVSALFTVKGKPGVYECWKCRGARAA